MKIFESTSELKTYWDFPYYVPPLPTWIAPLGEMIALASIIPLIWIFLKRKKNGTNDIPSAMMGVFVRYVWLLPTLRHPQFIFFIPLFHSLQYLVFAGNVAANIEKEKNHENFLSRAFLRWWGMSFVLAALFFEIIPKTLDSNLTVSNELNTTHFFLIIFVVIINIHHFFIDSDLWRREVNLVRPYLKPINPPKEH